MKKGPVLLVFCILSILFIISGCRSRAGNTENPAGISDEDLAKHFDPTLPTGTIEFTHYVLDIDDIYRIVPLGAINPPGHTLPTERIYILAKDDLPSKPLIYAPAGGKILHIHEPGDWDDSAIRIGVTDTMS